MRRALLFLAIGLILLGAAGWIIFPDVRSDIVQKIPWFGRSNKPITLVYWGLWEPREVIQPLLDQYQKDNPEVTIEYQVRSPEDHFQTVQSRLKSEGAPDIIRVHSSWVPFIKDNLQPIPAKVMTTQKYEQTFYPVNEYFLKYNDQYYGIPLMIDGLALVYNQKLFAEEGIINPPKNWSEFRELAARLTKTNSQGEIVQAGAALGYANNIDYFADILGLMFAQNGVQFTDAKGKVNFHQSISPVGGNLGAEALSFYTLFAKKEQTWNPAWGNSTSQFTQGKVAMVFLPSHRLHEILSRSPSFRVGVSAVPQLPVVSGTLDAVNWANYWVEVVSRTSANGEAAWKFLNWLSAQEQLSQMYKNASMVRSFGEPFPRTDMSASLSGENYTLPYVQQGPTYTTWYFQSGTFTPTIDDRAVEIMRATVESVAGGQNAETELKRAATEVQKVLDNAAKL